MNRRDMMVRYAIAAALLIIPALASAADGGQPSKAEVDPSAAACRLLTDTELATYLGAPVRVTESRSSPSGTSSCHWQGGRSGVFVNVALFPEGSAGIRGSQSAPEELFEATIDAQRRSVGEDYLRPLDGVGDRAYRTQFTNNPTNAHSAHLLRHGASATLNTFGLGAEPMVVLARAVAAKM